MVEMRIRLDDRTSFIDVMKDLYKLRKNRKKPLKDFSSTGYRDEYKVVFAPFVDATLAREILGSIVGIEILEPDN